MRRITQLAFRVSRLQFRARFQIARSSPVSPPCAAESRPIFGRTSHESRPYFVFESRATVAKYGRPSRELREIFGRPSSVRRPTCAKFLKSCVLRASFVPLSDEGSTSLGRAPDSWSGSARGGCNQQKSVDFVVIVQSGKLRLETRRPQDPDRISARGSLRRRLYHQQKSVDLVVIVQELGHVAAGGESSKRRVQEGIPEEDGTLWSPAVLYGRFPEIDDSRRSEQRDMY
ncbi:hypothetical protein Bbelb_381710 [Branchiostoma belcheri]|nr:hypothetical protein Bbelb_381710 [Branchiostoma belcheri]